MCTEIAWPWNRFLRTYSIYVKVHYIANLTAITEQSWLHGAKLNLSINNVSTEGLEPFKLVSNVHCIINN